LWTENARTSWKDDSCNQRVYVSLKSPSPPNEKMWVMLSPAGEGE
jgi:hypothetical protein